MKNRGGTYGGGIKCGKPVIAFGESREALKIKGLRRSLTREPFILCLTLGHQPMYDLSMKPESFEDILDNISELEVSFFDTRETRMASAARIEQVASEYIDLFDQNPALEAKALEYKKPQAKSHERNKRYYEKLQSEMQALALSTLERLASNKCLNAFEEEVRQELLMAQEMGIVFPEGLIFRGKKDSTLESMKNLEATFKHENDLDHLDTIINGMNDEERSRFQRVARKFVEENLSSKGDQQ